MLTNNTNLSLRGLTAYSVALQKEIWGYKNSSDKTSVWSNIKKL